MLEIREVKPFRRADSRRRRTIRTNRQVRLDSSGLVTINIIRAEMGQHVGAWLGRIVAEELEAD